MALKRMDNVGIVLEGLEGRARSVAAEINLGRRLIKLSHNRTVASFAKAK